MLKFTSLVIILFSMNAFASTNGGGVLMKNFSMSVNSQLNLGTRGDRGPRPTPEIVFHMGQKNGFIRFAYGYLKENQWEIQKVEMPEVDLMTNALVVQSLRNSKSLNSWVEIK